MERALLRARYHGPRPLPAVFLAAHSETPFATSDARRRRGVFQAYFIVWPAGDQSAGSDTGARVRAEAMDLLLGGQSIDVLHWNRFGYFRDSPWFSWVRIRDGERLASVETPHDSAILHTRNVNASSRWKGV